ncbi:fluoride efflux transporter CrcB [Gillisia sp. Q332]|uniref:fluoride efflux transporter CrcB n=1 Tax=Gillisia xinjiangensis TaxID=3384765 RepID=UPI00391A02B6
MKVLLMVFLGGGLGSSLRYLISKYLNEASYSSSIAIPLGTFTVNFVGSLLLGLILGLALKNNSLSGNALLFLATGFCGGFTTFSAFAFENQELLKSGDYLHFAIYTLGTLILGFSAIFVGLYFSKLV